jgi:hypothetical protein
MRTLILLGLFVAISTFAGATERVTVNQLEQKLAALVAAPHADSAPVAESAGGTDLLGEMNQDLGKLGLDTDRAAEIDALELTERLTGSTLARLTANYNPGPQIRHALEKLADRSALLDPPAGELPNQPPPDADGQRKMLAAAGIYVLRVLTHLPNFFAIRTTERFDDAPVTANGVVVASAPGLHLVGSTSREITFRDGAEVIDPMQRERVMPGMPDAGLTSSGEFGPEAAMVLVDLAKGTYAFHHWEQTPAGLAAVYRYAVPGRESHYQVGYSCQASVTFHDTPGYHGSLAIDPASGAILRLTVEVDSKKGDPISHVATAIEYGPVVIGGRRYISPLRSLAFMVEDANACMHHSRKDKLLQPVTMLNRTSFSDFHRLGSSAKIVSEPTAPPDSAPAVPKP